MIWRSAALARSILRGRRSGIVVPVSLAELQIRSAALTRVPYPARKSTSWCGRVRVPARCEAESERRGEQREDVGLHHVDDVGVGADDGADLHQEAAGDRRGACRCRPPHVAREPVRETGLRHRCARRCHPPRVARGQDVQARTRQCCARRRPAGHLVHRDGGPHGKQERCSVDDIGENGKVGLAGEVDPDEAAAVARDDVARDLARRRLERHEARRDTADSGEIGLQIKRGRQVVVVEAYLPRTRE